MFIIGVGIQGEESLLPEARQVLGEVDLVLGDSRLLREMRGVGEEKKRPLPKMTELPSLLRQLGPKDRVAILASGDPNFFGVAEFLYRHLPPEDLEVLPNVSSMQWAFARLRMGWSDATLLSAHGRGLEVVVEAARRKDKVGLFTDPTHTPSLIARRLREAGVMDLDAYVLCDLGSAQEQIVQADLRAVEGMDLPPRNVMILVRCHHAADTRPDPAPSEGEKTWQYPAPGIPDDRFATRGGMITKEEIRCLILSKARIEEESLLWDVGAGCGSISIEAARLARRGRVYAIERDREQLDLLQENRRRFSPVNLEIIAGEAPEALSGLPAPDRIVVGGSGGRLSEILAFSLPGLKRGGRIIVVAVSLSTLSLAWQTLKGSSLTLETLSIQLAKGQGDPSILKAHNPIYLLIGDRP